MLVLGSFTPATIELYCIQQFSPATKKIAYCFKDFEAW